jgi:hypothetical protein
MLVDDFHQRARACGAGFKVSEFQGFNVTGKSYRNSKFQGNRKHQVLRSSLPRNKKKSPAKASDRNLETLKL